MKYHPDRQGCAKKMQSINEAYEALKNPEQRKVYDGSRRGGAPLLVLAAPKGAKEALEAYMTAILKRDFSGAYDLISSEDQKRMPRLDFVRWQKSVGTIFKLRAFDLKLKALHPSVVFEVMTEEYNAIMETTEHDLFLKKMHKEKQAWKVGMGINALKELIEKYESLSKLLILKKEIRVFETKIAAEKYLLSKEAFNHLLSHEIARFNRYQNPMTLLVFDIKKIPIEQWIKVVHKHTRTLDTVGHDFKNRIALLLPETSFEGGIRTALKLKKHLMRCFPDLEGIIAVEMYLGKLDQTFLRIEEHLNTKKRPKGLLVVSSRGLG